MIFLLILLAALGTGALIVWNLLLFKANGEHEEEIAHYAFREYKAKFAELEEKYTLDSEALEKLTGWAAVWYKLWNNPKTSEKKATELQKKIDKLESGNFKSINFTILPGYAAFKLAGITADNKMYMRLMTMFSELSGREYASNNARYVMSCMISIALGGVGFSALLGVLMVGLGEDMGLYLAIGGPLFAVVFAYALFDGIRSKAQKRKDEITSDLAQAVTEIALLTGSGMEVFRAWGEVCSPVHRRSSLYREMRQVTMEINNGFNPASALDNFIKRCGTKETTRLGASILQNLTRGNDELSIFLGELSQEVWEERKHNARRLGEQSRSKLMFPMMLIFVGILIMIIVPIFFMMSDMGF